MALEIAAAVGSLALVVGALYGCYLAGWWKRDRDWHKAVEERQREATAAMGRPVPTGGDLVDEL